MGILAVSLLAAETGCPDNDFAVVIEAPPGETARALTYRGGQWRVAVELEVQLDGRFRPVHVLSAGAACAGETQADVPRVDLDGGCPGHGQAFRSGMSSLSSRVI